MDDKTDSLFHEGKLVATRKDYKERIQARVANEHITEDQAWASIREELLGLIAKDTASKAKKAAKGGSNPPPTAAHGRSDPPGSPPTSNQSQGQGGLNGNLLDGLPEDAVPQELKGKGITVMDAIASGQLKLSGEHPAAEVLRKTITHTNEASEAQRQIELEMPGLQYPQLRQTVRIMPSDFNRTSLFHVGSNNLPRRFCKNEKLGRVGDGVTIFYQGEELRQNDEAVFRQIIHVARGNKPWEWISVKQAKVIQDAKGTKRHLSGKDTKEYHDTIMRLRAGLLLIQSKRRGAFITCNLLSDYEGVGDEQRVRIDPRVALLFDSYAALDENVIDSISGVAQKIYNFIQTIPHSGIHPILIKNLFELCYGRMEYLVKEYRRQLASKPKKDGEEGISDQKRAELAINKKYSDFHRKNLPMALDELKSIGLIISYEINRKDDKVAIVKNPQAGAQVQELSADSIG